MKVLLGLVALTLALAGWYAWDAWLDTVPEVPVVPHDELDLRTNTDEQDRGESPAEVTLTPTSTPPLGGNDTTTLYIAMLDYEGKSSGPARGCDKLVFVEEQVPKTTIPLTVALKTLFGYTEAEVGGWNNFVAKVRSTLSFEKAEVVDGTAKIYLTGELTGLGGVCDDPRAKTQIEETALRFDTVDRVELYLNGVKTDLQPNEQGI